MMSIQIGFQTEVLNSEPVAKVLLSLDCNGKKYCERFCFKGCYILIEKKANYDIANECNQDKWSEFDKLN